MADRINVQVIFKKFWWTCPVCKQEDIVDAKVEGGNEYVHICSKCGASFNQSGSNMKEYNGSINYPIKDYENKIDTDITKEKSDKMTAWIYEVKNPPPYIEPTKEILEQLKAEKMAEVNELQAKIDAKVLEK